MTRLFFTMLGFCLMVSINLVAQQGYVFVDNGDGNGTRLNCIKDGTESGPKDFEDFFVNIIDPSNPDSVLYSCKVNADGSYTPPDDLPNGTYTIILTNDSTEVSVELPKDYSFSNNSTSNQYLVYEVDTLRLPVPDWCILYCLSNLAFSVDFENDYWWDYVSSAVYQPDSITGINNLNGRLSTTGGVDNSRWLNHYTLGNPLPNDTVFGNRKSIQVLPNTTYRVTYSTMNQNMINRQYLDTYANGEQIGDNLYNTQAWRWRTASYAWYSGSDTELFIIITNRTPGSGGNDFGLDGITVTEVPTIVSDCDETVLSVQFSKEIIAYQWYLDGVKLEGDTNSTINRDQEGDYVVEIHYGEGCTSVLSFPFEPSPKPDARIKLEREVGACSEDSVTLKVTVYNTGKGILPPNIPVSFYEGDPTEAGAERYADTLFTTDTILSEDSLIDYISVGVTNKKGNIYGVVNDNDTIESPIVLPNTNIIECDYSNNFSLPIDYSFLSISTEGKNPTCYNAKDGSAFVIIESGTGPFSYEWNGLAGDSVLDNLDAGKYLVTVTGEDGCSVSDSMELIAPEAIIVDSIVTSNVSCFGVCDGQVSVSVYGGVPPYNYDLGSGEQSDSVFKNLCENTYLLIIKDSNDCFIDTSFVIETPSQMVLNLTSDSATCLQTDSRVTVEAVGAMPPYTYLWDDINEQTTETASNLYPGKFRVVVTDDNDCKDSAEFEVQSIDPIELKAFRDTVLCFGDSVTLTTTVTKDVVEYFWNDVQGEKDITVSPEITTNYQVYAVDDRGCFSDTQTVVVTINDELDLLVSSDTSICYDGEVTLKAIGTGGTPNYAYYWDGILGTDEKRVKLLETTSFSVTIIDELGCEQGPEEITVEVADPVTIDVSSDTLICPETSVEIGANATGGYGNYSYNWTPDLGTESSYNVSPEVNTIYSVWAEDEKGCSSIPKSIEVTIMDYPTLRASEDTSVCPNEPVQLNAFANGVEPIAYSWRPGLQESARITVTSSETTIYTVTITDACNNSLSEPITVSIYPLPEVEFTVDENEGCVPFQPEFIYEGSPANDVLWGFGDGYFSNSSTSVPHIYENVGDYDITVFVTSENGCKDTLEKTAFVSVHPLPKAEFRVDKYETSILQPEFSFYDLSTNIITEWEWNFNDFEIVEAEQEPKYSFPDTGNYFIALKVTNQYGCKDETIKNVRVNGEFNINVPNAFTPTNNDGVNDIFPPKEIGLNYGEFEMWIFNRWGEMIYYTNDINKPWNGSVDNLNEAVQLDTYVYKIKGESIYGDKVKLIGKVTVIK